MEPQFWRERWQKSEIGFHEAKTNPLLAKYWPTLGVPAGAPVFVPLCGKSLDMIWLASQGHRVIGIELSEIAVRDFFAENNMTTEHSSRDGFEITKADNIEIWCGDLFKLQAGHLAGVAGVYDRASLVAMPPAMQSAYASQLIEVVPAGAPMLVLTFDYQQSQMPGPPFSVPAAQVAALYGGHFKIDEVDRRDALASRPDLRARGLTRAETPVFVLRRS